MQVTFTFGCRLFTSLVWCASFVAGCAISNILVAQDATAIAELEQALCSSPKGVGRENPHGRIAVRAITVIDGKTEPELRGLAQGTSPSLALLAAWELVSRAEESSKVQRLHWFLGFLEGRLAVSPPEYWVNRLNTEAGLKLDASQLKRGRDVHCTMAEGMHRIKAGRLNIGIHQSQQVHADERHIVFQEGERECRVGIEVFAPLGEGKVDQLSYYMDAEILVVAMIESAAGKYPVYCFDSRNGRLIWSQTAWGHLTWTNAAHGYGPSFHCLDIRRAGDRIFLFGNSYPCYCEAYHVADGTCALRFSSCAWFGRQLKRRWGE